MFVRPAREEDFQGYEVQYDHFRYMSDEVKSLIEQDNLREAIHQFRKETGKGLTELKRLCEEYQKYVFAKRDFESGKPVFVSY